jgi:hypothetical protein
MRPARAAARLRAIRAGRHEHGRALLRSSSKTKPEPSQRFSGHALNIRHPLRTT